MKVESNDGKIAATEKLLVAELKPDEPKVFKFDLPTGVQCAEGKLGKKPVIRVLKVEWKCWDSNPGPFD